MTDQPSTIHVVPTALERSDGLLDLSALALVVFVDWELMLHAVPWWLLVVPTLIVALWVLTGEAAGDVQYVGAVASGLRSKLGLRRAHEWVFAAAYFWRVAVYPVWRSNCVASYQSARRRTTVWHQQTSAAIRWRRSQGCSWASATLSSWSVRRAKLQMSVIGRVRHG